jgi:transmembrane sensor
MSSFFIRDCFRSLRLSMITPTSSHPDSGSATNVVSLRPTAFARRRSPPPCLSDFHLPPAGGEPPSRDLLRLIIAFIGALVFSCPCWFPLVNQRTPTAYFSTTIGKRLTVRLTDGSSLTLNTNTALTIESTRQKLHVNLKKGELLCNMTENAVRNLVVTAGNTRITDVGTIFSVQRTDQGVQLVVKEGVVLISGAGFPQVSLVRNQRALVDTNQPRLTVDNISPDEVARRLSWRHGHLIFQSEKLSVVIRELNRYNANIALAVTDPAIANMLITATLDPTDPVGFLKRIPGLLSNVSWTIEQSPNGASTYKLRSTH